LFSANILVIDRGNPTTQEGLLEIVIILKGLDKTISALNQEIVHEMMTENDIVICNGEDLF
jgi:hypothetical protein